MPTQPKKKTIDHNLTGGAVNILKQLLPRNEWYAKRPNDTLKCVNGALGLLEGPLVDLPEIPTPDAGESQEDYDKRVKPIIEETHKIPMTEDERKAARECIDFHLKGGKLNLTKHVGSLIQELEVE